MSNTNIMCVYSIVNNKNNKIYIGSTRDFFRRKSVHISSLKLNKHYNKQLQNDFNLYGEGIFQFNIIERVDNIDELIIREQYWIDYYKSYIFEVGYNICEYAGSRKGLKVSDETKQKLSLANMGRTHTTNTKRKLSLLRKGENNPFFGKIHNEESRLKISKKRKGQFTDAQREVMKNNNKLNKGTMYWTENTYKKLKEINKGEKSKSAKLKEEQVIEILNMIKSKVPYKQIEKKYGVKSSQISRIKSGIRWAYLKERYPYLYV